MDQKIKESTEGKTTYTVAVHKAAISLKAGESINDFTRELSTAGKEHVFKKLNLMQDSAYAWMAEAFGDHVVFDVEKRGDGKGAKYFAFTYKRDDSNFTFGDLTEVERVTTFRPKKANIKKSKGEEEKIVVGDWKETKKSMWGNIL